MDVVTLLMHRIRSGRPGAVKGGRRQKCPERGESKIEASGTPVPEGHCLHIGFVSTRRIDGVPTGRRNLFPRSSQIVPLPMVYAQTRWSFL
jgi:hypothetical protein